MPTSSRRASPRSTPRSRRSRRDGRCCAGSGSWRGPAFDFAFETTLSGLALRRTIDSLHAAGYSTHLVYLWLPDAQSAVERVRGRVQLGGHDVADGDIRRRYVRSLRNFARVYRGMVRHWQVRDATGPLVRGGLPLIARGTGNDVTQIYDAGAWKRLQDQAVEITEGS